MLVFVVMEYMDNSNGVRSIYFQKMNRSSTNSSKYTNDATCSNVLHSIYYNKIIKSLNVKSHAIKYMLTLKKEKKKRLFYLYHLSIVSDGNRHYFIKKLLLYKKLEILPFQKVIDKLKNEDLPTLFYGPFSYFYDLIRNKYNFKNNLPSFKKNIKVIASNELTKFKEIRVLEHTGISLLVYSCFFLKILNQYRDKKLSFNCILYKFLNTCDDNNVIETIAEICNIYYFHALQNEMTNYFTDKKVKKCGRDSPYNSFQHKNLMKKRKQIINGNILRDDNMFQNASESVGTCKRLKNGIQTKESANLKTDFNSKDHLNDMSSGLPLDCDSKIIPLFYPNVKYTDKEKKHILANSNSDKTIYKTALADFIFSQQNNVWNSDILNRNDLKKITPSKTDDVTKIKGWRNKQFYLRIIQGGNMNCHINRNIASVNISSKKTRFLEVKEDLAEDQHVFDKSIEDLNTCTNRNVKSVNISPENGSFHDLVPEELIVEDNHINEKFIETNIKNMKVENLSPSTNRNVTHFNISPEYMRCLEIVLQKPLVEGHHIIEKSMDTFPTDSTGKYDDDLLKEPTNLNSEFLFEGIPVYHFLSKKESIENPCAQIYYKKESKLLKLQKTSKPKTSKLEKISKKYSDKMVRLFKKIDKQNSFSLADVFIWCYTHSQFDCNCTGKIMFLKQNKLLWKPSAQNTYLSSQDISKISIYDNFPHCHIFSPLNHSARTFGSLFNYKLRNSNPIFKCKRFEEMNNFVLSSTNSLLKINRRRFLYPYELDIKKPKVSCTGKINEVLNRDLPTSHCKKYIRNEEKQSSFKEKCYMTSNIMKVRENLLRTIDTPGNKKSYEDEPAPFQEVKMILAKPDLGEIDESKSTKYSASYSSNINLSNKVKENNKSLFKYGLLCLTEGFGFLLVKEFTANKLLIQDPLHRNVFRFFKDLETANEWLNSFLKKRMLFESADISLKWVVVKSSILKYSHPFDKSLIENSSKYVNKDGDLVEMYVKSFKPKMKVNH